MFFFLHSGSCESRRSRKRNNTVADEVDAHILELLKANIEDRTKTSDAEKTESDLHTFFFSTYETVKKFSKTNQRLAKRRMLDIINELEEKDESERDGLLITDASGTILSGISRDGD